MLCGDAGEPAGRRAYFAGRTACPAARPPTLGQTPPAWPGGLATRPVQIRRPGPSGLLLLHLRPLREKAAWVGNAGEPAGRRAYFAGRTACPAARPPTLGQTPPAWPGGLATRPVQIRRPGPSSPPRIEFPPPQERAAGAGTLHRQGQRCAPSWTPTWRSCTASI